MLPAVQGAAVWPRSCPDRDLQRAGPDPFPTRPVTGSATGATASDAIDDAKDAASDAADAVGDAAHDAKDAASDAVDEAKRKS